MNRDDDERKFEVYPPGRTRERASPVMPDMVVPVPPEGSTLFNRIKWRIARRNMEEYNKMIAAVKAGIIALADLKEAELYYQSVIEKLEDSDKIHATARMKRYIDYINTQQDLKDAELSTEERERAREKRRRKLSEDIEEQEPLKPWEKRIKKLERLREEETKVREWFENFKKQEIEMAGGEDNLSEEMKNRIDDYEMIVNEEIRRLREEE